MAVGRVWTRNPRVLDPMGVGVGLFPLRVCGFSDPKWGGGGADFEFPPWVTHGPEVYIAVKQLGIAQPNKNPKYIISNSTVPATPTVTLSPLVRRERRPHPPLAALTPSPRAAPAPPAGQPPSPPRGPPSPPCCEHRRGPPPAGCPCPHKIFI